MYYISDIHGIRCSRMQFCVHAVTVNDEVNVRR